VSDKFESWWLRAVNAGIPLDNEFELKVVKAHCEMAYKAGLREGKKHRQAADKLNSQSGNKESR